MAGADDQPRRGRTLTLGELSAFFAFIAAGIYVVGLVGLWLPIVRTYTQDFSAAWYAVSLAPRTVVAGHGVALLQLPLVFLGVMVVLVLGYNFIAWGIKGRRAKGAAILLLAVLLIAGGGIYSLVYVFLIYGWPKTYYESDFVLLINVAANFLLFCSITLSIALFGWLRPVQRIGERPLPVVTSTRRLLAVVAVYFGSCFMVALMQSVGRDPPLPTVEVAGTASVEGKLLAHVDRFWYVFEEDGTLVALPEEEVTSVRITSS